METMTVAKIWLQFALLISKFYDCTKFHYHLASSGKRKVTDDQNFQMFCSWPPWSNSVIAVNGDEKIDLENTQLYQKASRSSLT